MNGSTLSEKELLKVLIREFLIGIGNDLNPQAEITGLHTEFVFTEIIKSDMENDIFSKLERISDNFERVSDNAGLFKHEKPDCEVHLTRSGDLIELKMVAIPFEDYENQEEMKILGESCRKAFTSALESVHQANKF